MQFGSNGEGVAFQISPIPFCCVAFVFTHHIVNLFSTSSHHQSSSQTSMTKHYNTPLIAQGVELYRSFLTASQPGDPSERHLQQWVEYESTIVESLAAGTLDSRTASAISTMMSNVCGSAAIMSTSIQESKNEVDLLVEEVRSLVVSGHRCELISPSSLTWIGSSDKRKGTHDDYDRYRTPKRSCRPTTTKYLPTPSPPPSTKSLKPSSTKPLTTSTNTTAPDPVRQYFLTHLSSPYPSPSEKEKLCKKAKITRRKLESDLTNWRRRSDWTDIMNTYCGGDKSAMRTMIACIERGEERDVELLERFGRMKAYLEKRDEQAGEWVYQVCSAEAP
jgi:hypothetical protein